MNRKSQQLLFLEIHNLAPIQTLISGNFITAHVVYKYTSEIRAFSALIWERADEVYITARGSLENQSSYYSLQDNLI